MVDSKSKQNDPHIILQVRQHGLSKETEKYMLYFMAKAMEEMPFSTNSVWMLVGLSELLA